MSVIELLTTYDISAPLANATSASLCASCSHKGKSFLCLVIKKDQYPMVLDCEEYQPTNLK